MISIPFAVHDENQNTHHFCQPVIIHYSFSYSSKNKEKGGDCMFAIIFAATFVMIGVITGTLVLVKSAEAQKEPVDETTKKDESGADGEDYR